MHIRKILRKAILSCRLCLEFYLQFPGYLFFGEHGRIRILQAQPYREIL